MTLFARSAQVLFVAIPLALQFLSTAAGQQPAPAAPLPATTAPTSSERTWLHATSLIGDPKYQPGFARFDYVNPEAPKGGVARLEALGTFDSFNPIASKGEAAEGLGLIYESLMTSSQDEVSTNYGLLAEALSFPPDFSSVTYRLNANARWHDGQPVTAEDVVWSFDRLKEVNASQSFYYRHVQKAEKTGEREVTFTFDEKNNRELPNIVGQLPVLPMHWWTATNAQGVQRNVAETLLEAPLGSGPYKVTSFSTGRNVTFERVPDYWGAALPVNVGQHNFDRIAYIYFRDDTVAFEAFKGNQFDWWSENKAARWATGYDFPAVKNGWVIQERYQNPYRTAGLMVGFTPNLRRPVFQDARVRKALNLAFDFETLQRTLFFGEYARPNSFFFNTELASESLPQGRELEFLEAVRDLVPASVFTEPYVNPVGGDNARIRDNLRRAVELLKEAGFEQRGGQMVNTKTGEPLSFELLLNGPTIEGVAGQYQQSLKRIGIDMRLRAVDPSQYVNRIRSRDYDMIYSALAQSLSPGNEQYDYWGSESADRAASQNYAGIRDPGVDALIRNVVQAANREDLLAATRALDRVLLANQYVIPSYVANDARVARWNRFSHPAELPEFSIGWPSLWWYDAEKAAALPTPQ